MSVEQLGVNNPAALSGEEVDNRAMFEFMSLEDLTLAFSR